MQEDKTKKKLIKHWINIWGKAGVSLKRIKNKELASFDYKKNLRIIDDMLQLAVKNAKLRINSGLVEQQHLFSKLIKNEPII